MPNLHIQGKKPKETLVHPGVWIGLILGGVAVAAVPFSNWLVDLRNQRYPSADPTFGPAVPPQEVPAEVRPFQQHIKPGESWTFKAVVCTDREFKDIGAGQRIRNPIVMQGIGGALLPADVRISGQTLSRDLPQRPQQHRWTNLENGPVAAPNSCETVPVTAEYHRVDPKNPEDKQIVLTFDTTHIGDNVVVAPGVPRTDVIHQVLPLKTS